MIFSKDGRKTVYFNSGGGLLEVKGEGVLIREDTEALYETDPDWNKEYDTLSVTEGVTGLAGGYLEEFPHINCLILGRTVGSADVSPGLLKKWRKRKTLVRGEYDTFAERFAGENSLAFLHSDIPLAAFDYERAREHDIVTLRFHPDGPPDIHFNCFTPGSSAGNFGGGEYAKRLPKDFYAGLTVEEFAEGFPEQAAEQIMSNETLRRFLEISNGRLGTGKTLADDAGAAGKGPGGANRQQPTS